MLNARVPVTCPTASDATLTRWPGFVTLHPAGPDAVLVYTDTLSLSHVRFLTGKYGTRYGSEV